jgi:hypothetical protein
MYVLLYTDSARQPCFVQGTIAEINAHIAQECADDNLGADPHDFLDSSDYNLLCIEDGRLTPINAWFVSYAPQFTVN